MSNSEEIPPREEMSEFDRLMAEEGDSDIIGLEQRLKESERAARQAQKKNRNKKNDKKGKRVATESSNSVESTDTEMSEFDRLMAEEGDSDLESEAVRALLAAERVGESGPTSLEIVHALIESSPSAAFREIAPELVAKFDLRRKIYFQTYYERMMKMKNAKLRKFFGVNSERDPKKIKDRDFVKVRIAYEDLKDEVYKKIHAARTTEGPREEEDHSWKAPILREIFADTTKLQHIRELGLSEAKKEGIEKTLVWLSENKVYGTVAFAGLSAALALSAGGVAAAAAGGTALIRSMVAAGIAGAFVPKLTDKVFSITAHLKEKFFPEDTAGQEDKRVETALQLGNVEFLMAQIQDITRREQRRATAEERATVLKTWTTFAASIGIGAIIGRSVNDLLTDLMDAGSSVPLEVPQQPAPEVSIPSVEAPIAEAPLAPQPQDLFPEVDPADRITVATSPLGAGEGAIHAFKELLPAIEKTMSAEEYSMFLDKVGIDENASLALQGEQLASKLNLYTPDGLSASLPPDSTFTFNEQTGLVLNVSGEEPVTLMTPEGQVIKGGYQGPYL